jgi:hypothetical protein
MDMDNKHIHTSDKASPPTYLVMLENFTIPELEKDKAEICKQNGASPLYS